jgi:hypothetical protein
MDKRPEGHPLLRLFAGMALGFFVGVFLFFLGLRFSVFQKNRFFDNASYVFNFGFESTIVALFYIFWMLVIPFVFIGALLVARKQLPGLSQRMKGVVRWILAIPLGWSASAVLHVILRELSGSIFDSLTQPMLAVAYSLRHDSYSSGYATTAALLNIVLLGLVLAAMTAMVMARLGPLRREALQSVEG